MARVRLNKTEDLPEDYRWMFDRMEKNNSNLNIFRALSHSPEAMRRFMKFGQYLLGEGKLDAKLREMAILKAGYICRSPYEFSQHIAFARRVGLSDDQIRAIADPTAGVFAPHELAVLTYAAELTSEARASDAAFAAVAAFLSDEQIVELTLTIGFYNMVSRTLNALEVDVDAPAQADLTALGVAF